jgi:hypothetical protein
MLSSLSKSFNINGSTALKGCQITQMMPDDVKDSEQAENSRVALLLLLAIFDGKRENLCRNSR